MPNELLCNEYRCEACNMASIDCDAVPIVSTNVLTQEGKVDIACSAKENRKCINQGKCGIFVYNFSLRSMFTFLAFNSCKSNSNNFYDK